MAFSRYMQNIISNYRKGTDAPAAPAAIYLALFANDPTDSGDTTAEPTDAAYQRHILVLGDLQYDATLKTYTSNTENIVIGPAEASWGTIRYGAIFDSPTKGAGNMLDYWQWQIPKPISVGSSFTLAVGDLDVYVR